MNGLQANLYDPLTGRRGLPLAMCASWLKLTSLYHKQPVPMIALLWFAQFLPNLSSWLDTCCFLIRQDSSWSRLVEMCVGMKVNSVHIICLTWCLQTAREGRQVCGVVWIWVETFAFTVELQTNMQGPHPRTAINSSVISFFIIQTEINVQR